MEQFTITITSTISKERLGDLLETAVYGSPWLSISSLRDEQYLDDRYDEAYLSGRCRGAKWSDRLMAGGHIVCIDHYSGEDNEDGVCNTYKINLRQIIEGLENANTIAPGALYSFLEEAEDYEACDTLLQIILFGEIVYC